MKYFASFALTFVLLGSASAPVVAQPKASQGTTQVRVFEGPN